MMPQILFHSPLRATAPKRTILTICASLIAILTLSFSLFAQSLNDTVRGRVSDINNAALNGATVTLVNLSTGLERIVTADADGNYAFTARQGRYKITASATGFASAAKVIEAINGKAIDFALEPGGLSEHIVVVSGSRQEELRESLNTKVDVIGRNRIRDTGYESVAEVLQELPGVLTRRGTASGNSGSGGEQIQGIDSRQVL
ncbi:MAG TPA: TonB-dependent receptor, partial [Blastocatellia bacterium]|nr:TonB-dependent receptor [Blastocatellia bacterium]